MFKTWLIPMNYFTSIFKFGYKIISLRTKHMSKSRGVEKWENERLFFSFFFSFVFFLSVIIKGRGMRGKGKALVNFQKERNLWDESVHEQKPWEWGEQKNF